MTITARLPLGRILLLDAATCAATGVLLIAGAWPIAGLTTLPVDLLFWAGLVLIPVAVYIAAVARLAMASTVAVWLVILGNIGWIGASLLLFAFVAPNGFGVAFILAQAAVVGALTWLEFSALRGIAADAAAAM